MAWECERPSWASCNKSAEFEQGQRADKNRPGGSRPGESISFLYCSRIAKDGSQGDRNWNQRPKEKGDFGKSCLPQSLSKTKWENPRKIKLKLLDLGFPYHSEYVSSVILPGLVSLLTPPWQELGGVKTLLGPQNIQLRGKSRTPSALLLNSLPDICGFHIFFISSLNM